MPTRMTAEKIVTKLHKTRRSINAHCGRGLGLGENGNINRRGCELVGRYDDLRTALCKDGYSPEWKAYCDTYGSDYRHTGHDLFA